MTERWERKRNLWMRVFGASPDWMWLDYHFLEDADWDRPGRADVTIYNTSMVVDYDRDGFPEFEKEGQKVVDMDDLWAALDTAIARRHTDACTGDPIHENMDWDACSADVILQIAVLGEVVFG